MYGDPGDDEATHVSIVHCDVLFEQRNEDREVEVLRFCYDLF